MADKFKQSQDEYVKILREKLGEFMLVILDMTKRGVMAHKTLTAIKKKTDITNIITSDAKKDTDAWAEDIEINTLSILLYNNGFPFQMHNKIVSVSEDTAGNTQIYPPNDYFHDDDALYKSYFIFGDLTGGSDGNANHYTLEFPNNLLGKTNLPEGMESIESTENVNKQKIKIEGDGHCFYRAMAVWCMIYGITQTHLELLSYDIPFDFDKDIHLRNFKVVTDDYVKGTGTEQNKIPQPGIIEEGDTIIKETTEYVRLLKDKLKDTSGITFKERDITESDEYKYYLKHGVTKNEETHCFKYTGNVNKLPNSEQKLNI
jgi:hypothetical protein